MSVLVRPLRFTDDVAAMSRLLVALGLTPQITSEGGQWATFMGRSGGVALHSAATSTTGGVPGQTQLAFDDDDVDTTAAGLRAAGYDDVALYDEAYGRALDVTVDGARVILDAVMDDLYGYRTTGARPGAGDLDVCPIRFVADQSADRRLLETLGLSLRGEATPEFTQLSAPGAGGTVGLHYPFTDELPIVPGPFAVQLTFETTIPLPEMVQRAQSVGAPATLHASEFGDYVTLTDPDGQEIQVHSSPADG